jgi:hypothetical protein
MLPHLYIYVDDWYFVDLESPTYTCTHHIQQEFIIHCQYSYQVPVCTYTATSYIHRRDLYVLVPGTVPACYFQVASCKLQVTGSTYYINLVPVTG